MVVDGRVGEVRQWRSLSTATRNRRGSRVLGRTRNRRRSAVRRPFRSAMADWRFALPFLFVAALLIFEDLITVPSCVIYDGDVETGPIKLKAMIVGDLLLKGTDAGYADAMFRNVFISRFFRKSYEKLEPDMLVILGDISAKRSELGKSDWSAVLQQLFRVIGPFDGGPLVVGLGERDVGECSELDQEFVAKIANGLPGLDRSGSASFRFENVSFLLINDVALLCNENALRFGVEKLIESESFDLRAQLKDSLLEAAVFDERYMHSDGFPTLKSYPPSGSGPVLLLHFPLSHGIENNFERNIRGQNLQRCERKGTDRADRCDPVEVVPSQLMQTLPLNETEYILQSLRPRIVFSAHRQHFSVYNHSDGTREVTVPAMTWAISSRPGFVFAAFGETKTGVSHCSLAREMHVVMGYLSILLLLLAATVISRGPWDSIEYERPPKAKKIIEIRHSADTLDRQTIYMFEERLTPTINQELLTGSLNKMETICRSFDRSVHTTFHAAVSTGQTIGARGGGGALGLGPSMKTLSASWVSNNRFSPYSELRRSLNPVKSAELAD